MSKTEGNIFNREGDKAWPSRKDRLIKGVVSTNTNVTKQVIICEYQEYTLTFII